MVTNTICFFTAALIIMGTMLDSSARDETGPTADLDPPSLGEVLHLDHTFD